MNKRNISDTGLLICSLIYISSFILGFVLSAYFFIVSVILFLLAGIFFLWLKLNVIVVDFGVSVHFVIVHVVELITIDEVQV